MRFRDIPKIVDPVEGHPSVFIRRINISKIEELEKLATAQDKRAAKAKDSNANDIDDFLDIAKFMWKELIVDEEGHRFEDMIEVTDDDIKEQTDVPLIRQIMKQVLDMGEDVGVAQT